METFSGNESEREGSRKKKNSENVSLEQEALNLREEETIGLDCISHQD